MKIVIVNTSDTIGGAARASYRLHRALIDLDVDSKMVVQSKNSMDYNVIGPTTKLSAGLAMVRPSIDQILVGKSRTKPQSLFSPARVPFSSVIKKINSMKPDIVHLHWVCGGFIRIEDIPRINAPIVLSLHDVWTFTGGCHIVWDCVRYKNKCGHCPQLNSKKYFDLSWRVLSRKRRAFAKLKSLTIVGLSQWITNCAKESSLFKQSRVINLPNNLSTDLYKPLEKSVARDLCNLPQGNKLILFGGKNAVGNAVKGFEKLIAALKNIDNFANMDLVVYGDEKPSTSPKLPFKIHYFGNLSDDISLISLYSACDVLAMPSICENLSNNIMESLSCGLPVVAYDIGGNRDMVEHLINGYLAKPFDTVDFGHGISWVLNNPDINKISDSGRGKIISEYENRIVAKKYLDLYRSLIN
ncbi:MAG: glycosyltransferase [Bacteroidetes bacterium]|nr:glycosyltransferase [Bacteroidota bacterium]